MLKNDIKEHINLIKQKLTKLTTLDDDNIINIRRCERLVVI